MYTNCHGAGAKEKALLCITRSQEIWTNTASFVAVVSLPTAIRGFRLFTMRVTIIKKIGMAWYFGISTVHWHNYYYEISEKREEKNTVLRNYNTT